MAVPATKMNEVLSEEFMKSLNLSLGRLAKTICCTHIYRF